MEAVKYLDKEGFNMIYSDYDYTGEGIYKNEKVKIELSSCESGHWVSYYLDKPYVIAAFNDSTQVYDFR